MNDIEKYWNQVNSMPAAIAAIAAKYWDETGRPTDIDSYPAAVLGLLNMSDDYESFKKNYQTLFFNANVNDMKVVREIDLMWVCFIGGMRRVVAEMENRK